MNADNRRTVITRRYVSLSNDFYHIFQIARRANEIMVKSRSIDVFNFTMVFPKESNINPRIRREIISYAIAFPRFREIACSTLFLRDIGEHCRIFRYYPEDVRLTPQQIEDRELFIFWYNSISHDFNTARRSEIINIPISDDGTVRLRFSLYVLKIASLYQTLFNYLERSSQGIRSTEDELREIYRRSYRSMMDHVRNAQNHIYTF